MEPAPDLPGSSWVTAPAAPVIQITLRDIAGPVPRPGRANIGFFKSISGTPQCRRMENWLSFRLSPWRMKISSSG